MSFKGVFPINGRPSVGVAEVAGHTIPAPPMTVNESVATEKHVAGVREQHSEQYAQNRSYFNNSVTAGLTAGQEFPFAQVSGGPGITHDDIGFTAQTLIIENPTNYLLFIPSVNRFVPPQVVARVMRLHVGISSIRIIVISGTVGTNATFGMVCTEQLLEECPGISSAGAGSVTVTGTVATNLTQIGGNAIALGQSTMANSLPVTIASNQGPVSENLTQVGGATISLGQATMANSIPVTLASNQSNVPENLAQVGGAAISLGQATMANSIPVAISSNQSTLPENLAQMNGVAVSSPTATNGYVQVAEKAANNSNSGQQTSTAASAQMLAARATRKRWRIRNLDAANSVWYKEGAAATTTSVIVKAGESEDGFGNLAVNIIDNGSHATVEFQEWYD